jgi:hypothetical protein
MTLDSSSGTDSNTTLNLYERSYKNVGIKLSTIDIGWFNNCHSIPTLDIDNAGGKEARLTHTAAPLVQPLQHHR